MLTFLATRKEWSKVHHSQFQQRQVYRFVVQRMTPNTERYNIQFIIVQYVKKIVYSIFACI